MFLRSNRVAIPRDLASVTTFDPRRETAPTDVGLKANATERIWKAVEAMYRSGLHPGVALTVRRHGKVILDRAIGHARGNAPGEDGQDKQLLTPETPVCLFSASKALSAMLIHKLSEQGKLSLDDRVADYLPEYGNHGKEQTTLRQLLTMQAGFPPGLELTGPSFIGTQHWVRTILRTPAGPPGHGIRAGRVMPPPRAPRAASP